MRLHRGALAVPVVLLTAACGGGTSDPEADRDMGAAGDGVCDRTALEDAAQDGPVEITFWHVMTDHNGDVLESLIDDFHDSQDLVEVNLVLNNGYGEQQEKFRAGLTTGDLPDLVQHQEIFLQQMIDTETALPVQACLDQQDQDLEDYLARTTEYYAVEDVQWALPFNVNTPVMIYNRTLFEAAGLDPDDPPATLDELHTVAQALVDAADAPDADPALADLNYGMGLKRDGWLIEQFLALQGEPLFDERNGRGGRVTSVVFDNDAGLEVLTALNDLVADGLAVTNPTEGPNSIDNLTGMGSGAHAITFDSSGALGPAAAILENQFPDVEPGVAPLPGRTEDGGALIGGGSLYISTDDPVVQAAAWELARFLTSPEVQAEWAAETGFIPVRESALDEQVLLDRWDEVPYFRVAYDQLVDGPENEVTAGPVLGEYRTYREAAEETVREMFEGDLTPDEALSSLASATDDLITRYNDRVEID
jgi:sn-glycerol 3-phosphate transport system substrate-binding protein